MGFTSYENFSPIHLFPIHENGVKGGNFYCCNINPSLVTHNGKDLPTRISTTSLANKKSPNIYASNKIITLILQLK